MSEQDARSRDAMPLSGDIAAKPETLEPSAQVVPISSQDWEARLADARSKRAQALATRAKQGQQPQRLIRADATPPELEDWRAAWEIPAESPLAPEPETEPELSEQAKATPADQSSEQADAPARKPTEHPTKPTNVPSHQSARGVSRVPLAAFALGLGVGIPVALAMLWIGHTNPASILPAETTATQVAEETPPPQVASFAPAARPAALIVPQLTLREPLVDADETIGMSGAPVPLAIDVALPTTVGQSAFSVIPFKLQPQGTIAPIKTVLAQELPSHDRTPRPAVRPGLLQASVAPEDLSNPTTLATDEEVQASDALEAFAGEFRLFLPSNAPTARGQSIASAVQTAGGTAQSPVRTSVTVGATHIRFYHSEDADLARAAAAEIGAEARDFTSLSPKPPAGNLEIWIAGRGAASTTSSSETRSGLGGVRAAFSRLLNAIPTRDPQ